MKTFAFALAFCLLLPNLSAAQSELIAADSVLQVGDRAPIFSLVDHEGRLVSYDDDYYGRHHLVLTFFPAAFTPV